MFVNLLPTVNIETQAYFYGMVVVIGTLVVDGGLNIFRLVVVQKVDAVTLASKHQGRIAFKGSVALYPRRTLHSISGTAAVCPNLSYGQRQQSEYGRQCHLSEKTVCGFQTTSLYIYLHMMSPSSGMESGLCVSG